LGEDGRRHKCIDKNIILLSLIHMKQGGIEGFVFKEGNTVKYKIPLRTSHKSIYILMKTRMSIKNALQRLRSNFVRLGLTPQKNRSHKLFSAQWETKILLEIKHAKELD